MYKKTSEIQEFGLEVNTAIPGEIRIAVAGAEGYREDGVFINLIFRTRSKAGLAATTRIGAVNVNEQRVNTIIEGSKDVNGDNEVNELDFKDIVDGYNKYEGQEGYDSNLDINKDGVIDIFDMIGVSKDVQ